jgi:hypothetical protein
MGLCKVDGYEVYKTYLGISRHFNSDSYDYFKYNGKVRCSIQSFYKNKNRFWFEKLGRKYSDKEILELFVSNYSNSEDISKIWIGNLVREGETLYTQWKKKTQSLTYTFKSEVEDVFTNKDFDGMFKIEGTRHPQIIKEHLVKNISLETMVILNKIIGFKDDFDKNLSDPVWKFLSMRINKYNSFIHIDVFKFKSILKEIIVNGS